jgi:hypothetical protein
MGSSFLFPGKLILRLQVWKSLAGKVPPPDSDPALATLSLEKSHLRVKHNSPQARIADLRASLSRQNSVVLMAPPE